MSFNINNKLIFIDSFQLTFPLDGLVKNLAKADFITGRHKNRRKIYHKKSIKRIQRS